MLKILITGVVSLIILVGCGANEKIIQPQNQPPENAIRGQQETVPGLSLEPFNIQLTGLDTFSVLQS